ncbi:RICIN domain-containing protein [Virgisporangium aurantiacum]|uniref:Ricin B lectin domain-containing protein n=1 Tax=Virgisporangium aurantiacum TaxID=175570 RepID=A0A8J3Z6F0_9ACTN|nr:hypothetical protein [Virgisporangium aurantiacum]GIJ57228.1 hypothetical protein Vau01_047440 [Virgisporangium aurantiacum]
MTMRARTIGLAVIATMAAVLGLAAPALTTAAFAAAASTGAPNGDLHTFRNTATGRCLDSGNDGSVYTLGCNAGWYQLWRDNVGGLSNFQTRKCLDPDVGGTVFALVCNRWDGQYYEYVRIGNLPDLNPEYSGIFTLKPLQGLKKGMCLDSNGNGNVYMATCNNGMYQQWAVTFVA